MDFDPQPSSSSSSSSASLLNVEAPEKIESRLSDNVLIEDLAEINVQEPLPSDKMEAENLQSDSQPESEAENEDEAEDESLMKVLPAEMLMKILENLNVYSLADSRLVSQKWNGIAREIIKSRDDVETVFYCWETQDGDSRIWGRSETEEGSLKSFTRWFEDSKDEPLYTRFQFRFIKSAILDHADWIQFASVFGEKVKCLKLIVHADANDLRKLISKLRKVFANDSFPTLGEFGLYLPDYSWLNSSNIQLFPTTADVQQQLPHLKVLYLDKNSFREYTGIFTDLLRAAGNLQKIEWTGNSEIDSYFVESLYLLQSLGKLQCLKTGQILLDADFLSAVNQNPQISLDFKLKELYLIVSSTLESEAPGISIAASVFLSNLFQSSKDTLTELRLYSCGILPHFQLPKFSKLTRLTVGNWGWLKNGQNSPAALDMEDSFPVLQTLELLCPWTDFFPHDENQNVQVLPNLRTLVFTGREMTGKDVARISQACPNLKELKIYNDYFTNLIENFPEVATAIWTHLKQLKSLYLRINTDHPANSLPDLDSCFTGLSREYCIRLQDLILAEELLKKSGWGYQIEMSEAELKVERKNPSILDLKELENLTIRLWMGSLTDEINPNLSKKVLAVSENYAFQLMENLNYKISK